jgi:hypothetical protein
MEKVQRLQKEYKDENNPYNQWQGGMRFGYFDFPLFKYACQQIKKEFRIDGIVVNHLDEFPNWACLEYENLLSSYGEKHYLYDETHYLRSQEDNTKLLIDAEMIQYGLSEQTFLKEISQICPVEIISYGKTASDRKRLINAKR